jgi:hypothetical protein
MLHSVQEIATDYPIYLHALREMLNGAVQYPCKLETASASPYTNYENNDEVQWHTEGLVDGPELQDRMSKLRALYVQMRQELAMAKRESAWGKLRARDFSRVTDLCREILMPL